MILAKAKKILDTVDLVLGLEWLGAWMQTFIASFILVVISNEQQQSSYNGK